MHSQPTPKNSKLPFFFLPSHCTTHAQQVTCVAAVCGNLYGWVGVFLRECRVCERMHLHIPADVSVSHRVCRASAKCYALTLMRAFLWCASVSKGGGEGGVRAALGFCCAYCALSQINNSLHVYLTKGSWRAVEANPRYRSQRFSSD